MDYIEKLATTKYGDYKGKVSIDFHGMSEDLHSLCKAKGINTDRFFPIGFSIYDEDALGIGHHSTDIPFTIYSIDCGNNGTNFDTVASIISKNDGIANVDKHNFALPISEVGKYIKRFSLMAVGGIREQIKEIKIK